MLLLKIFTAILFTLDSLYYLWMLQLNGYFLSRSLKNLLFSKAFLFCSVLSIVQLIISLIFPIFALLTNFICGLLLLPFIFSAQKTPIRITNRIIRWISSNFIIFLLLCIFCSPYTLPILQLPVILLSNLLLLPLEKIINNKYLKKAKNKIKQMQCKVIIITGSYGKTSTKNILQDFLSTKYNTLMSIGNYNTPLGLAKFINSIKDKQDILILEAGAKRKGDIAKICKIFKPDYAIITGVTSQHLETFGSLKNIIETKGEVLDYLSKDGCCVINADDSNSSGYFSKNINMLSAGKKGKDYSYEEFSFSPNGSKFKIVFGNKNVEIETKLLGELFAKNITFAFALAEKLGCDPNKMAEVSKNIPYIPHRLELLKTGDIYILDDSYNANIIGVEGLLEVLSIFPSTKSIVSQGIVEVGKESFLQNYTFAKRMAKVVDYCAVIGQNSQALYNGLLAGGKSKEKIFICKTLDEAVEKLLAKTEKDGVIAFQNDLPDNMLTQHRRLK